MTRWFKARRSGFRSNARGIAYWEERAAALGRRAVIDSRYSDNDLHKVTQRQRDLLLPLLRAELQGWERTILDVGCGAGRFTPDLAEAVGGTAVGIDPVAALLDVATPSRNVTYRLLESGQFPVGDDSVDVVWVCSVLDGLDAAALQNTVMEIARVMRNRGVLVLVENTVSRGMSRGDDSYWVQRSPEEYRTLFSFCDMRVAATYTDWDDEVAVMIGRRAGDGSSGQPGGEGDTSRSVTG